MDKDHHLDAPDNESLRVIEQLDDRSELSAIYPHAHKEWEQDDMLSHEDREKKRDKAQEAITTSIRPWFVVIGLLTPVPFALVACLLALGATYITADNLGFMLLPIIFGIGLWVACSYFAIHRVHTIFYNHALRTIPFVAVLLCLLAVCIQTLYVLTQTFQAESLLVNALIMSGLLLAASVIITGVLLFIWSSPRLLPAMKVGCIAVLTLLLMGAAVAVTVL